MVSRPGRLTAAFAHGPLAAVVALGLALSSWHQGSAELSPYTSAAVRSMSQSWHALLFGAYDPAATISIDKLPGWLAVQALFVRVLGFHAWVLDLPQILGGAVATVALYAAVRRWRGRRTGLVAALAFVLTPVMTPTFAHPMEDGLLACCLVLALERAHVAAVSGRLRPLFVAIVWIAVGFQMKMAEAWLLLPAVVVPYAWAAPVARSRRLWASLAATAACIGLSLTWIVVWAMTPASSRPWVDGTTNNDPWTMVFGYNGLSRFGIHVPGVVPDAPGLRAPTPVAEGWTKLLSGHLAVQISWLLPLALAILVAGLWQRRRTGRTDADRVGFLLWGLALVAPAVAFSVADRIPHVAYAAVLGAPVAALAAPAIVAGLRGHRPRLVAVVVAAQTAWAASLWTAEPHFLTVLAWASAVTTALLALACVRWPRVAAVAALSILAAPACWTMSTLDPAWAGTSVEATAGPRGPALPGQATQEVIAAFGTAGADFVRPATVLSGDAADLWSQAASLQGSAQFRLATVGWYLAQPFILAGSAPVLPTGGFSHAAPQPTLGAFAGLVGRGQVRAVLVGGGLLRAFSDEASVNGQIVRWVVAHCRVADTRVYAPGQSIASPLVLFDCGAR